MTFNSDALDRYITGNYGEDQFDNTPYPADIQLPSSEDEIFAFIKKHEENIEIKLSRKDILAILSGKTLLADADYTGIIITFRE